MSTTKITTTQIQRQILAPAMQQSIEILLLPLLELQTTIEQELQNNPLLETIEKEEDTERRELDAVRERLEQLRQATDSQFPENRAEEEFPEERNIKSDDSLEELLLRQLRVEFDDPLELKIGELIIGNINETGYLTTSCAEIAHVAETDNLELVEKILATIQHFEPAGIAARDLRECLLAQISSTTTPLFPIVYRVIDTHLPDIARRKFRAIAKNLSVPVEQIKKAAHIIASLDPKPARNYRPIRSNIYIKPDIFILADEDRGYQIYLNDQDVPSLRINSVYKNMLTQIKLSLDEKTFIREKLRNALHFIKSIEQRGQTIREIAKFILEKQKGFFEQGPASLVPMSLKDVAQRLERNESTISRAIANKYVVTPQGLYALKFFFSQGLEMASPVEENAKSVVSNRTIKEEIRELINSEDKLKPLSDQELQNYFSNKGMKIARRTISKYRQILDILPSHLRKQ